MIQAYGPRAGMILDYLSICKTASSLLQAYPGIRYKFFAPRYDIARKVAWNWLEWRCMVKNCRSFRLFRSFRLLWAYQPG